MFAFKYLANNFLFMCFFVHNFWNGVSLTTNLLSFQLRTVIWIENTYSFEMIKVAYDVFFGQKKSLNE